MCGVCLCPCMFVCVSLSIWQSGRLSVSVCLSASVCVCQVSVFCLSHCLGPKSVGVFLCVCMFVYVCLCVHESM